MEILQMQPPAEKGRGGGGRKTKGRMPEWLSLKWVLERTAVLLAKPLGLGKHLGSFLLCLAALGLQSSNHTCLPGPSFLSFFLFSLFLSFSFSISPSFSLPNALTVKL